METYPAPISLLILVVVGGGLLMVLWVILKIFRSPESVMYQFRWVMLLCWTGGVFLSFVTGFLTSLIGTLAGWDSETVNRWGSYGALGALVLAVLIGLRLAFLDRPPRNRHHDDIEW